MTKETEINNAEPVASPCIGNCCLDRDDICLGCFRHINEITQWRDFSHDEKRETLVKCSTRKIETKP